MLGKLTPGTEDFKKHENRVTELKARFAAGREQAQREFQSRECENIATIYKEVQLMVTAIAQWRKINYVVKVRTWCLPDRIRTRSRPPLQNTMVYFDPRNDITNDVIYNLNRRYKAVADPPQTGGNPRVVPARREGNESPQPGEQHSSRRTDQRLEARLLFQVVSDGFRLRSQGRAKLRSGVH